MHLKIWTAALLMSFITSPAMAESSPELKDLAWISLLDTARENPAVQDTIDALLAEAEEELERELIRRVYSLDDIGKHRTRMDRRAPRLEPEIQETFALSMSDTTTTGPLNRHLPQLAAAYRLTGDSRFRDRINEQLKEMSTWSPLQRTGWTLHSPGRRLPDDGETGSWLATGFGVRAIADTLEVMPEGSIDPEVLEALHELLEAEIAQIVDDWESERQWFVRSGNAITNQWVLPTEGLIRACLILGKDEYAEAYDLGVRNIMTSFNAHGPKGEFAEGLAYATVTLDSLLSAARAMAADGDHRALETPFLQHFPVWLAHHLQPGGFLINAFDSMHMGRHTFTRRQSQVSLLVACTGHPVALWLLEQAGGASADLPGIAAAQLALERTAEAPPLYAEYEVASRVNWRSSWSDDATGFWMRGGHPEDQHDHRDRGHVNFIAHGKPILIEAGTGYYGHPLNPSHYSSGAGHNVLQLGDHPLPEVGEHQDFEIPDGWQPRNVVAPLEVHRLDDHGGDVTMRIDGDYKGLSDWERRARWHADQLLVEDHVTLADGEREVVLFRWHLGLDEDHPVDIRGEGSAFTATWNHVEIQFNASADLEVRIEPMPDATMDPDDPTHMHPCLVVRSAAPVAELRLETRIDAPVSSDQER